MRRIAPSDGQLAALVALAAAAVALARGLPATVDGALHVHRALSAAYLLAAAPGWPRWAPHFLQGWGYPIHHFYPPGTPLAAAALITAGAAPAMAHVALIAAAWVVAVTGTYRLARTALPPSAALLAAGAAAFSPVRLFEVQVQGNLPQLIAVALVPWALAAAVDAVRSPGRRSAVALGVPIALIALNHHVTTVLVLPIVALLAGIECAARRGRARDAAKAAGTVAAGLAIAALLACVYWLPALADAPRVQLAKAAAGMFDAATELVPVRDLVRPLGRIDRTAHSWPFHHGWGPVAAALALAGCAAIGRMALRPARRGDGDGVRLAGFVLLGIGATIFTLPLSAPLWRSTAAIGLVQFPWRLLAVAEPLLATAVGAALLWLPARRRPIGLPLGLAALAAGALPWLAPIATSPPLVDPTARAAVLAERQRDAPIGTTSSQEYLPNGAKPDLSVPPSDAAMAAYAEGRWWIDVDRAGLPAELSATTEPLGRRGSEIVVGPGPAAVLRLRQLGFPGWRTTVDGQIARNERDADRDGALVVALPASAASRRVVARFVGTPVARGAGVVSAAAWLALLAAGLAAAGRRKPGGRRGMSHDDLGPTVRILLGGGLVVSGAVAAIVVPSSERLAPRSAVAAPASMEVPLHVNLGAGSGPPVIELLGFDAPANVYAGRALDVRLYWRALRPMDARYRPFVQLLTKGTAAVVANHTSTDPGGRPTRSWPLDRFVVDDHRLAVAHDAGPITARLIVGLFDDATGQRLEVRGGGDIVELREVRIEARRLRSRVAPGTERGAGPLAAVLPVRFGERIVLEAASARRVRGPGGGSAIAVTLVWRATEDVGLDATVFRHVLDAADASIAQLDGPPAAGDAPTGDWRRGDIVVDDVLIPMPDDTVQPVRVEVGLYTPADGVRLPTWGGKLRLPDDSVRIPITAGP